MPEVPAHVRRRGLFDPTTVARLVSDHVDGWRDHRKILWALLMLDAWCDHYLPHERRT
jgi:asparagine synthase (glutamine-hydrolysing)